ncbi:MAG: hypothetical protein ACLR0U_16275 [Enterocloster clostridioformis]
MEMQSQPVEAKFAPAGTQYRSREAGGENISADGGDVVNVVYSKEDEPELHGELLQGQHRREETTLTRWKEQEPLEMQSQPI